MTGVYLSKLPYVKQNAFMLLALLAMSMSCLGQSSPKEKNDSVFMLVKRYLNEKAEDSLYSLTGDYLPDSIPLLQYNGKVATIRTLSNHTSGIPRMPENFQQTASNPKDPYASYSTQDLYSFLHGLKLGRAPGSEFEYSNAAVGLLGTILQKLYGKSYEELLLSLIANPLKMTDTRVTIRPADSARVAGGYDDNGVYNWTRLALSQKRRQGYPVPQWRHRRLSQLHWNRPAKKDSRSTTV
jgi:CubicO group peptidase (beta-lactamase class C family)